MAPVAPYSVRDLDHAAPNHRAPVEGSEAHDCYEANGEFLNTPDLQEARAKAKERPRGVVIDANGRDVTKPE
jgi:hypothetical protein